MSCRLLNKGKFDITGCDRFGLSNLCRHFDREIHARVCKKTLSLIPIRLEMAFKSFFNGYLKLFSLDKLGAERILKMVVNTR